jgi:hypothetical protein
LANIGFDFGDVRLGGDGIAEGIAKRVDDGVGLRLIESGSLEVAAGFQSVKSDSVH